MKLMMYIGSNLVEAVPLNPGDLKVPGYLGKFKRYLKQKYELVLRTSGITPDFLVCNPDMPPERQVQPIPLLQEEKSLQQPGNTNQQ